MKFLSSVLVLLIGMATLVASAFIRHNDAQMFVGAVGFVVAGIGFGVWAMLMRGDSIRQQRGESSDGNEPSTTS